MAKFLPVEMTKGIVKHAAYDHSYSWQDTLNRIVQTTSGKKDDLSEYVVPVDAFHESVYHEYATHVRPGVLVELEVRDYKKVAEPSLKPYWLVEILKVAGYRCLCRWVGANEEGDERHHFWINFGSCDVNAVGAALNEKKTASGQTPLYVVPLFIHDRYEDKLGDMIVKWMTPLNSARSLDAFVKERKNIINPTWTLHQRVELLNYQNSRQVRPARVKRIAGRRLCVFVSRQDCDEPDDPDDDRQYGADAEFWVDQSSFFLFPVGWAALNGYEIEAKKDYVKHSQKVADAMRANSDNIPFATNDVKPHQIVSWKKSGTMSWEKGMKFELMDPLEQTFNELKVASVLEVLKEGYIRVGIDGPDAEDDSIPLHSTSPFLFPVGYSAKYNIPLKGPEGTKNFQWPLYLKQCNAQAAPEELFKEIPSAEVLNKFKPGAKLEAADMCENNLICPATIVAHKGRLLQVHFDGWESSFDQLFDVNSNDIYPVGWCELHGYKLEIPRDEEPPKKKKK